MRVLFSCICLPTSIHPGNYLESKVQSPQVERNQEKSNARESYTNTEEDDGYLH